jgi:hypothetical protein
MTVEYTVIEKVPSAEAFCHLRVVAGMSPRPWKAPEPAAAQLLWRTYPLAGDADRHGAHRRRRRD